jgi:septum formation topological specificity factor MinE
MMERYRQEELKKEGRFKFTCSDPGMSNLDRLACLDEESGEVARECLHLRNLVYDRPLQEADEEIVALRTELIQVIAICFAWLESECNSIPIAPH